jgi:hypothetical protein
MKNGKAVVRLKQVVGWMLFGLMIAGPNLLRLYSQDSRLARQEDRKSNGGPLAGGETVLNKAPTSRPPQEKVPPPDIILPDIFISIPSMDAEPSGNLSPVRPSPSLLDSTRLKQKLQKAELELPRLRNERLRLLKTMEQLEARRLKGVGRSVGQRRELLERPSV